MSLTLHSHPLASFCWKVLIALHDTGTPFRAELVDFSDPGSQARLLDLWPVGKMPVLHDAARDRAIAKYGRLEERFADLGGYAAAAWSAKVRSSPATKFRVRASQPI